MRIAVIAPAHSRASIERMLRVLFELDVEYLRTHRDVPALYDSGVRYQLEDEDEQGGLDEFLTVPEVMRAGVGDCEDLASWRAAELVVSGEDKRAKPYLRHVREGLWHVVVMRGNGELEDPSRVLGMGVVI